MEEDWHEMEIRNLQARVAVLEKEVQERRVRLDDLTQEVMSIMYARITISKKELTVIVGTRFTRSKNLVRRLGEVTVSLRALGILYEHKGNLSLVGMVVPYIQ